MKAFRKRIVLALFLFIAGFFPLFSYDLTFKAEPMGLAPFLSAGKTKWGSFGGGGFFEMGIDLFGTLDVGPAAGYF